MRHTRSLLIATLLVSATWAASAVAATPAAHRHDSLPAAWLGTWRGTLRVLGAGDVVQDSLPMSLTIAPDGAGRWTWRMVYGTDTVAGLRDYRLEVVDAADGRWVIDERNGLRLETRRVGDTFVSAFRVQGRTFLSRDRLVDGAIEHEIVFWRDAPVETQQGAGANAEQGMAVDILRVGGVQRARLARVAASGRSETAPARRP